MQNKYAFEGPTPRVHFTMTPRVLHFFEYEDPKSKEVKRLSANARVLWDWLMQLSAPGMIYQYLAVYGKHPLLERELAYMTGFSRGKIQYLKRELEAAGLITIKRETTPGKFTLHTIRVNEIWEFNEAFTARWGELVKEGELLKRGSADDDEEDDKDETEEGAGPTIGQSGPTISQCRPTIGHDGPTISTYRPTIGPLNKIVKGTEKTNGSDSPSAKPKRLDPIELAMQRQERVAKEPWRAFIQEVDVPELQRQWAAYFAVLLGHSEDGKPSDARIGATGDKRKDKAERREWMATTANVMQLLNRVPVKKQKEVATKAVRDALGRGQTWRNPGSFSSAINAAISAHNLEQGAPEDGGPVDLDAVNASVMGVPNAD